MTMEAFQAHEGQELNFRVSKHKRTEPLRECVQDALTNYFKHLDGHNPTALYKMVISEVEQPLLRSVMDHAKGNQTRAARILGISRSTLRKKLSEYSLE